MIFGRLGKQVRLGTFGKIKVGGECPKSSSVNKHEHCSDPISANPICPFPNDYVYHMVVHNIKYYVYVYIYIYIEREREINNNNNNNNIIIIMYYVLLI